MNLVAGCRPLCVFLSGTGNLQRHVKLQTNSSIAPCIAFSQAASILIKYPMEITASITKEENRCFNRIETAPRHERRLSLCGMSFHSSNSCRILPHEPQYLSHILYKEIFIVIFAHVDSNQVKDSRRLNIFVLENRNIRR